MRLRDLGEKNLIKTCLDKISRKKPGYEYNDVAYLKIDKDYYIVTNIEGYVIDKWKLSFTSWRDCGWRACAGACSDLIAKLSRPLGLGMSIDLPGQMSIEDLQEIIEGLVTFSERYGTNILKLDTNESDTVSISVYAVGISTSKIPISVKRRCKVFTRPVFGYTGIVFKLYYEGTLYNFERDEVVKRGIEKIRRPELDTEILNLDPAGITASTDSSDGLGASLWLVSELSNAKIVVENIPAPDDVVEFCYQNNIPPLEVVFNGGEEYVPIIFTDSREVESYLIDLGYICVGYVEPDSQPVVLYRGDVVTYRGWEYFKRCYA